MAVSEVALRALLKDISDNLLEKDVKDLKFLLQPYKELKKSELESAESGIEIFNLMTESGLLSINKLDILIKILNDAKRYPLSDKVTTFMSIHKVSIEGTQPTDAVFSKACNIQPDMIVEHFKDTSTLELLKQKLEDKDFVTLYGLLGSGKSQLALKYGCIFRERHKDSICWRLSCQDNDTVLNSLKRLADRLGLEKESKQDESKSVDESLNAIKELILGRLNEFNSKHLLIFDDVTEDSKKTVEKIIDSFLKSKVPIKILVTTWNAFYADDRELIAVNGFTEIEAVEFLCNKAHPTDDELNNFKELAFELSRLPLALYGAKTYMKSCYISPSRFIKNLREVKSIEEIENLVSPTDDKKLFTIMMQFLELLKKDEEEIVFDKILALQFVETEDIPVLLFDFLPSANDTHEGFSTDKFIQALHKFSFGFVRGQDDGRYISTHSAVKTTIDRYTVLPEKVRILKKLLKAFMWLMDKDNNDGRDYNRNQTLLPHAISTLQHAQTILKRNLSLSDNLEFYISLVYVYDLVGYTYNFFGILYNAGHYSTEARKSCFVLIGENETNILAEVQQKVTKTDDYRVWTEYAKNEAMIISEHLTKRIENESIQPRLNDFAHCFVLNKYRSKSQIELLEEYLGHKLQKDYILTEDEYEKLCGEHLAIPRDELGSLFIWELFMQVFYTYGRRVFYLSDSVEKNVCKDFAYNLFLAREIGQLVAERFPKWKVLYTMLTEISGTLEQQFDDKACINQTTAVTLKTAVARFEDILKEDAKYFIFGVIKVHTVTSSGLHTKKLCYKRILHCYSRMTEKGLDEENKDEIRQKGEMYTKKLQELTETEESVMFRQAGYDLRTAEFKLATGDYENAEVYFKKVVPSDIWSESEPVGKTSMKGKELIAAKSLVNCLTKCEKIDEARRVFKRLKSRLEDSNEVTELAGNYFSTMAENLKLN